MNQRQTIIVYGDSLMLSGVQASLKRDASFSVIARTLPVTEEELRTLQPHAVIFDIQAVQPEFRYALAQELPGLLLIGIDPETHQMVLWSGQTSQELTLKDLTHVIGGRPAWLDRFDQLRGQIVGWGFSRKQKLAIAVVVIGLCSVSVLVLWLVAGGNVSDALSGAAVNRTGVSELELFFFIAGLIVGGILIGLWMRYRTSHRSGR